MVQYFVGAGFYVIPTYSPADFSVDNTVASTPAVFLRNWANLWTAITEVSTISQYRLGPFAADQYLQTAVLSLAAVCVGNAGEF